MRKNTQIMAMVIFMVRLFTACVLAFGAFIGAGSEPALQGIFWLFTAVAVMMGGIAW